MRFKTTKKVIMCLTTLVMLFALTITAFAENNIIIKVPSADKEAVQAVFSDLTGTGSDGSTRKDLELQFKTTESEPSNTGLAKFSGDTLTFNLEGFQKATNKSRKKALSKLVLGLQNSPVSEQTQQNIFDTMNSADNNVSRLLIPLLMDSTQADLFTALRVLAPFLPFIRTVLGIGTFIVVLTLFISTVVDLAFIGLPVAREAMNNKGDAKGGKVPFVSADALSVVKESESSVDSSGKYKNAYLIYFKRRSFTYIILGVCILYLVVGELGGLMAWILSLADGIVN